MAAARSANIVARMPLRRYELQRVCHRVAFDAAFAPASSRCRSVSINTRTREGMCVRAGKTAHIPTSSGLIALVLAESTRFSEFEMESWLNGENTW